MTSEPSPAVVRVVLATRTGDDAARLLTEAGALARALGAELAGVFVEESDLLRLAELPVAREVGLMSGTVREITLAPTLRQLERQAADLRRLVAQAAAGLGLRWSFRVTRGSVLEVAVASVDATDVVLLAPPRAAGARRTPARRATGTVAALHDGGPAGERALAAALELAARQPETVTLVLPDDADPLPLRRRAAERLGVPGQLPDAVAVGELRHRPGRRALVVSVGSLPRRGSEAPGGWDLRHLLAAGGCPLVLVR